MYGKRQAKRKKYRQQNRGKRAGKPNYKQFCPKVKGQNSDDLSWNQTAYRMIIATLDRHINKQGYKFFNPASKFFADQVLRRSVMGKRPTIKARSSTEEEVDVL